jgi:hypothetical protein
MKTTTKTKENARQEATPGLAILITKDTDLGIAMLIAEDEDEHYAPIGPVVSVNEAYEIAASNLSMRRDEIAEGKDAGICPYAYRVWAAGREGTYRTAWLILASEL